MPGVGLPLCMTTALASSATVWKLFAGTCGAAARGSVDAQNMLGSKYFNGIGVSQDYREAARWYRMAAERGDEGGQRCLGILYEEGKGVPRDLMKALYWYNLAAARNADARTLRDAVAAGLRS